MFKDKSNMFEDFGFKLVVINSLLEKETSFTDALEEMNEKYVDDYDGDEYECIPEMIEFFENLELTDEDLSLVTELCFDGGEDIYLMIMPDWDGESEEFDVKSIGGFENLSNLKKVEYISMCPEELMNKFKENGIEVI